MKRKNFKTHPHTYQKKRIDYEIEVKEASSLQSGQCSLCGAETYLTAGSTDYPIATISIPISAAGNRVTNYFSLRVCKSCAVRFNYAIQQAITQLEDFINS